MNVTYIGTYSSSKRHIATDAGTPVCKAKGEFRSLAGEDLNDWPVECGNCTKRQAKAAAEAPAEAKAEAKPAKPAKAAKARKAEAKEMTEVPTVRLGERLLRYAATTENAPKRLAKVIEAAPKFKRGHGALVELQLPAEDFTALRATLVALRDGMADKTVKIAKTGFRLEAVDHALQVLDKAREAA